MVRDAEVWRINTVTAPSRAPASRRNFLTSAVRSVKPAPRVSTVNNDDMMVVAETVEGAERDIDRDVTATSLNTSSGERRLNLPRDILLHAVGHLDQPTPGFLQKRHHAVHIA